MIRLGDGTDSFGFVGVLAGGGWLAAQYRKAAEVIDAQVFAGQPAGQPLAPGTGGERAAAGRQRDGRAARLG
jgi:hypothetical protein